MGLAGISWPQLLIIVVIVVMIFGTKRIRQAGGDFGAMISGFKKETKDINTTEVVKDINSARKTVNKAKKLIGK
jgi:sec-independent protein translocase protein TatA